MQLESFKQKFFDSGETTINGSELLDQMDSYNERRKGYATEKLLKGG